MPRDDGTGTAEHLNTFGARLRAERERQGIGVRELSRRLDVSASMISQIERGRVMPSVNTLYSITTALGISLDDLFDERETGRDAAATAREQGEGGASERTRGPLGQHGSLVVRRDAAQSLELGSGVRWEMLTSEPPSDVDFLRTTYEVGGESAPAGALMRHNGFEYGTVLAGRLGVTVGFETFELEPGDAISFDSSTPHRLFNVGDQPAVAVWVVVGRRGAARAHELR